MLSEFKITQLRHFLLVAELKNFHTAAEKAHRTQPAISLSIRDFEKKLGEPLFEKRNARTNKTELTPFGQQILPKVKELLSYHDRVVQDVSLIVERKSGHLRLATVPSVASQLLPSLLLEFLALHPDLQVSFYDDNSLAVLRMIEKQQIDFGIAHIFNEEDHPDKQFMPLWEDDIGVVCPIDHPLASMRSIHWKALRQYPLMTNGTSLLLEDSEASPLLQLSKFHVSNITSLIAMLESGVGVTTLPRFAFPEESQTLVFVPMSAPKLIRNLGIIQRKNKTLTPAAQALVDHIVASQRNS